MNGPNDIISALILRNAPINKGILLTWFWSKTPKTKDEKFSGFPYGKNCL